MAYRKHLQVEVLQAGEGVEGLPGGRREPVVVEVQVLQRQQRGEGVAPQRVPQQVVGQVQAEQGVHTGPRVATHLRYLVVRQVQGAAVITLNAYARVN